MKRGLHFVDQGVRGVIVETVPLEYERACDRHAQLQAHVEQLADGRPSGMLVLRLIAEGLVLHPSTLQAARAIGKASLHRNGEHFEMELDLGEGWRDRRLLPGVVVEAIRWNRGLVVADTDLRWAAIEIAKLPGYAGLQPPIEQAILDAQCWWYPWLGGPLFAHLSRLRPWQPLDRAARARVMSGRPQLDTSREADPVGERWLAAVDVSLLHTQDLGVVDRLRSRFGLIVAEKRPKDKGRQKMLDALEAELPAAVQAGRAQTLIVAGTHHVVRSGGVRGKLLAPVTLSSYFSKHIVGLADDLFKNGEAGRSGWDWVNAYRGMLAAAEESQQAKVAAFLEAFHRFLVLVGSEPLPVGILASNAARPPVAAVVTDGELRLAQKFVLANAETDRIASQACIALLLASEIELRTYEPWCIRLDDVQLEGSPRLLIYPRVRDGIGKTSSMRRTVDLTGRRLVQSLSIFKLYRLHNDHADEQDDLLFGHPGAQDRRHEQGKTMGLVNSALRWATGWNKASFYDLRHTVFSRKIARQLQEGTSAAQEVAALHRIAAEGGHAGPGSSWSYIHQFEDALAVRQQKARPRSWTLVQPHSLDATLFPALTHGVLGEARDKPPASPHASKANGTPEPGQPLAFALRFEIAQRLSKDESVPAIAGRCQLPEEVVLHCIRDMATALVDADMIDEEGLHAVSHQILMIRGQRNLIAAAAHAKWKPLRDALMRLDLKAQDATARELWHSWLRCRSGVHLSLERARPVSILLDFLLKAGTPRRVMAITAPQAALPLPEHLKQHNLEWRRGGARPGVPLYRLSLVPREVAASKARARQVSLGGLHLCMVLLGSAILQKEK